MSCCDGWEAEPHLKTGVCTECEGDVNKDGDSVEAGYNYSPEVCKKCGWSPCDWSC